MLNRELYRQFDPKNGQLDLKSKTQSTFVEEVSYFWFFFRYIHATYSRPQDSGTFLTQRMLYFKYGHVERSVGHVDRICAVST